jgi:hypothetical protein
MKLIYDNPLASFKDVEGFVMEGEAKISFEAGRMRMENSLDESMDQKANFVYWCPVEFPENIIVEWDFYPVKEPGLAILFFGAKGINGESIFDPTLQKRTGEYNLYHHGDINAFHVSYFRRRWEDERAFHTCNLRKSYGFHMVAQGADPIPDVEDAKSPYHIRLEKVQDQITFYINDLMIFDWKDNGETFGKPIGSGFIGFRQMAPLVSEYSNLKVYAVEIQKN